MKSLSRLTIKETKVTPEGIDRLKKSLPRLRSISDAALS